MAALKPDAIDEALRIARSVEQSIFDAELRARREERDEFYLQRTLEPLRYKSDEGPEFWRPVEDLDGLLDGLSALIEREVYRALREVFSVPPNPDFVLVEVWPNPNDPCDEREGWGVKISIDGHGFEDLTRFFDVADFLREEFEFCTGGDGVPRLTATEAKGLILLAKRMRAILKLLDDFLERLEITED